MWCFTCTGEHAQIFTLYPLLRCLFFLLLVSPILILIHPLYRRSNYLILSSGLRCNTEISHLHKDADNKLDLLNPPRLKKVSLGPIIDEPHNTPVHILSPCPHLLEIDSTLLIPVNMFTLRGR